MDTQPHDFKPFFSNPTVRKVYRYVFIFQFCLTAGFTGVAIFVQPDMKFPLVLLWGMFQLTFAMLYAIIYTGDQIRSWLKKTYSPPQELLIWLSLVVIVLVVFHFLGGF